MNSSLLFIVSVIMIVGSVFMRFSPPNKFFGLRSPSTFSNPEIWKKANQFTGEILAATGLFILIITLVARIAGWKFWLNRIGEVVLLFALIAITVFGWIYGEILERKTKR